jgi:hypothetical protein
MALPKRVQDTLNHLLQQRELMDRYRALCKKGDELQVDLIEGMWPDYHHDIEVIRALEVEMLKFNKDLSEKEVMAVFSALRASLR